MTRILIAIYFVTVTGVLAQVVTYEANQFPEEIEWERVGGNSAVRSIEDGLFNQFIDRPGALDAYQRSLADFAGVASFFIEWRVETDAPSFRLDSSGAPVVLSAAGSGSIAVYHTTTTDKRVQLFRDTSIPLIFVDIAPDVLHTYRLEVYTNQLYTWYIDSEIVDKGIPQGPYPNDDSFMIWGTRQFDFDSTTRWDYIRYGVIPIDGSGDYDSNNVIDEHDYFFLHECISLSGPDVNAGPGCRFSDFDEDTDIDLFDYAIFQNNFSD